MRGTDAKKGSLDMFWRTGSAYLVQAVDLLRGVNGFAASSTRRVHGRTPLLLPSASLVTEEEPTPRDTDRTSGRGGVREVPISRAAFSDSWTRHYSPWRIVHGRENMLRDKSPSKRFTCVMTVLLKPVGTTRGPQMTRYQRICAEHLKATRNAGRSNLRGRASGAWNVLHRVTSIKILSDLSVMVLLMVMVRVSHGRKNQS